MLERLAEKAVRLVGILREEGPATAEHALDDRGPRHWDPRGEVVERGLGSAGVPQAQRRVDYVRCGQRRDGWHRRGVKLLEVLECLGRVAEGELQLGEGEACLLAHPDE